MTLQFVEFVFSEHKFTPNQKLFGKNPTNQYVKFIFEPFFNFEKVEFTYRMEFYTMSVVMVENTDLEKKLHIREISSRKELVDFLEQLKTKG